MTTIAFLGLGAMGSRMAKQLIAAGHQLYIWNRSMAVAEELARKSGAIHCNTPLEAAKHAEFVISMVRDDTASKSVWLGDSGAMAGLNSGSVAIECSTLTPSWTRELNCQMTESALNFVEAPLAGSLPQAEAGQLIFFIGGEPGAIKRCEFIFDTLGGAQHFVGAVGAGATTKLAVNGLFGIQIAAIAELIPFIASQNLDVKHIVEVISATPVCSPIAKISALGILNKQFAPMFPVQLVEKDFSYLIDEARNASIESPVSNKVHQLFSRAIQEGFGELNITGIANLYSQ